MIPMVLRRLTPSVIKNVLRDIRKDPGISCDLWYVATDAHKQKSKRNTIKTAYKWNNATILNVYDSKYEKAKMVKKRLEDIYYSQSRKDLVNFLNMHSTENTNSFFYICKWKNK